VAFQLSRRIRTAGVTALVVTAAITVPTVASAAPRSDPAPKPTIDSVQQRLGKLALQNDQVVEKYNQATIAYKASKVAAAKAATSYQAAVAGWPRPASS